MRITTLENLVPHHIRSLLGSILAETLFLYCTGHPVCGGWDGWRAETSGGSGDSGTGPGVPRCVLNGFDEDGYSMVPLFVLLA